MVPNQRFSMVNVLVFFVLNALLSTEAFQPTSQLHRSSQQQKRIKAVVQPFIINHVLLWGTNKKSDNDDDYDLEEERAAIAEVGGDLSFLDPEPNLHSGDIDDNDARIQEILELGGDPSFLEPYIQSNNKSFQNKFNDDQTVISSPHPTAFMNSAEAEELEAMGGDPFFLPRDAQVPEKDNNDNDTDEAAAPSTLLAAAGLDANNPSFLTSLVESRMPSSDATPKDDEEDYDNNHPTMEDLEAMGGDPSFLFPVQEERTEDADELAAMGGDPSFLQNLVDRQPAKPASEAVTDAVRGPPELAEGPYYTAMEGESFSSILDEVEALGGDPSFLDTGTNNHSAGSKRPMNEFLPAMESNTPRQSSSSLPIDLDPPEFTKRESKFRQRSDFTNTMMSNLSAEEEEILEIGGDPSFLASYDEADESKAYQYELERAEIEELGGDPFFL